MTGLAGRFCSISPVFQKKISQIKKVSGVNFTKLTFLPKVGFEPVLVMDTRKADSCVFRATLLSLALMTDIDRGYENCSECLVWGKRADGK